MGDGMSVTRIIFTLLLAVALWVIASHLARADVRILSSQGGQVGPFLDLFEQINKSGERVIIDGPCLSACTLLLGIVPRNHICVTHQAVLGFHAASYYDDASRSLVPTREGTRLVMQVYPPAIRSWIVRHGGLRPALIELRGRELAEMYPVCH